MTASQMRIAETIDAFYGDAGTRDGVSRSYKQAVEDLDAETIKALDGPYRCAGLLFRHQRMHQKTQQQTPRLRFHALQGQEASRKTRQGCDQTPPRRARSRT